jgi:hypothetical protein
MPLTLTFPDGVGGFPRAYIKGFISLPPYTMPPIVGNELHLLYPPSGHDFLFWITDRFLPPSSNVYSLDFVFDPSLSYFKVFGVPVANSIAVGLVSDPVDFSWRINVGFGLPISHLVTADLTPLPSYWRPL